MWNWEYECNAGVVIFHHRLHLNDDPEIFSDAEVESGSENHAFFFFLVQSAVIRVEQAVWSCAFIPPVSMLFWITRPASRSPPGGRLLLPLRDRWHDFELLPRHSHCWVGFLARSVRILLRVVKNTSTCSFLTSRWLSVKRNLILNEGFGFSTRFLDLMNGQDWVMWLQRWFREAQQSFHYLIIPGTGEDRANIMFPTAVVVCSIKMIHHWF